MPEPSGEGACPMSIPSSSSNSFTSGTSAASGCVRGSAVNTPLASVSMKFSSWNASFLCAEASLTVYGLPLTALYAGL